MYERQIATAKRLIKEKGELCVWKKADRGVAVDPTEPWNVPDVNAEYPGTPICWLPVGNIGKESQSVTDDGETVKGYFKCLMGAVPFEVHKKDTVLRGSDNRLYRIESIDTINVNGETILHTMILVL